MARAHNATEEAFCNQALKLLRQDVSISDFSSTPIAVKCGDLYELALDAVTTPLGLSGSPTDAADKRALVYALAKELALPVTGRVSDYEAMAFGFQKALAAAVRKKIEATITASTPELASLYRAFSGKEEDLPATYTVYSKRITAVQADSTATVKALLGIAGSSALTGIAKDASVALTVAKLAEACGYGADFVQLKMQEHGALIAEYRRHELDTQAESGEGSGTPHARLAAAMGEVRSTLGLASNATLSGLGLGAAQALLYVRYGAKMGYDTAFVEEKHQEYLAKIKAAFAETASTISASNPSVSDTSDMASCIREVRKTLAIADSETMDALALGAVQALYYSRYGERAGYEANFTEAKLLVYKSKLLEWRRVRLTEAAKEDPVLLTVLPSFAENDAALANGYAIYSAKRSTIEDACVAEINAAHGWATAFAVTGTTSRVYPTTHPAYPAFLYLCATRLAPVCGASPDLVALIGQKYSAALEEAKVKDFETARAAETDTDLLEAFALVRQYVLADGAVPWGWASVRAAYERIREGARRQVLEYYGWSFCRRAVVMAFAPPAAPGGEFTAAAPGDCARVLEAFDANGESLPVVMRGSVIYSRKPAFGLLYVADEELDEWPVTLRKAYVATIAATLAASMPTHDAQGRYAALVQYREETLSLARQADARQNRADYAHAVTGNRYTKAARGEDGRFPSVRGGFRHG